MGESFMNMLPYAIGILVSPVPIITAILTLFSSRAKANGLSFLLGWAMGIGLPAIVVLVMTVSSGGETEGPPSRMASMARIAVGILLMIIAIRNWLHRKKPDDPDKKPGLMRVVDALTPLRAWLTGFLFADVTNPKNMALTIAGCLAISSSGATIFSMSILLVIFVLIASTGVAAPVMLYLVGGEFSKRTVEAWKQWLVLHKKTVMAVLFIIFGIGFAYRGFAGLLS
jgi:hypothetical protein